MGTSNNSEYNLAAKFYRSMAAKRGHFARQTKLIIKILNSNDLDQESKILDAACGTGDVLMNLDRAGFTRLYGMDASKAMMRQIEKPLLPGLTLQRARWQDIGLFFRKHGSFQFIYLLGHSLPHLSVKELPSFIEQVHSGLNHGGIFAFDMRKWERGIDGRLRQPGRQPGMWRSLQVLTVNGKVYRLSDSVNYEYHPFDDGGIQKVTYKLTEKRNSSRQLLTELHYHIYDQAKATECLRNIGFKSITVVDTTGWPYLILIAKKGP